MPRPARCSPERGATALEYAMMAFLVGLVILAAVIVFGTAVSSLFATAASAF